MTSKDGPRADMAERIKQFLMAIDLYYTDTCRYSNQAERANQDIEVDISGHNLTGIASHFATYLDPRIHWFDHNI